MNRMFKLALGVVFTAVIAVPAMAQDMYPDVPQNHWAYDAIERLRKDNVLVPGLVPGYGDKYMGRCNLTRYEFAVYIDRLYRVMTQRYDNLQEQINGLKGNQGGTTFDPTSLQNQINELKAQVDGMKGWGDQIASMQRLVNEFQKELNGLDLNVTDMKKNLADLDARVRALEARKPAFEITGDADLAILAGHSTDDNYGLLHDGSVTGYGRYTNGGPVGLSKDATVLHNLALHLTTTAPEGPKVRATLVAGNVMDTLGNFAATRGSQRFPNNTSTEFNDANTDVYFQEFNATWNASLVGQGVSAKVGRFGWQAGKYIYQRPAYSSQYYADQYRDSGDYYMDGVALGFGFGKGSATVLYGRNSNLKTTNGMEISRIGFGTSAINVDSTMGVTLNFPIGEVGKINLAYLLHDSWQDTTDASSAAANGVAAGTYFGSAAQRANRIQTWGADATFRFNNIDFGAAYAKGTFYNNNSSVLDSDNAAWDVNAKFAVSNVKIGGGYRRVEKNFAALADTGRFGTLWNPRNFEGFNVNASFMAGNEVEVYGRGEFVKGVGTRGYFGSPLNSSDDKIDSYMVGVNFKANVFDIGLSYEDVKFKLAAGDAKQKWYTLGLGYAMSANSKLSIKYIFSDVDNAAALNLGPRFGQGAPGANGTFKGGLLATQLSVKF